MRRQEEGPFRLKGLGGGGGWGGVVVVLPLIGDAGVASGPAPAGTDRETSHKSRWTV